MDRNARTVTGDLIYFETLERLRWYMRWYGPRKKPKGNRAKLKRYLDHLERILNHQAWERKKTFMLPGGICGNPPMWKMYLRNRARYEKLMYGR